MDLLEARRVELLTRAQALPAAIEAWRLSTVNDIDSQLHFSQVHAIQIVVNALSEDLIEALANLPEADAGRLGNLTATMRGLVQAEYFWDYFRSKLDLRRSSFKVPLWTADTVAWSCYHPVMQAAVNFGAIPAGSLPEPPLTYTAATPSALTWMRGMRPNDNGRFLLGDGRRELPFPVIELPWEQLDNPWELMAIHHEVGHDLERDLKLGSAMRKALAAALAASAVPNARQRVWDNWMSEIFADLVGLQLGGGAFAEALATLVAFEPELTKRFDQADPHPTHYLRPLLLAELLEVLNPDIPTLAADAGRIRTRWLALYGDDPELFPFVGDAGIVSGALMDTTFVELNGHSVRELMPYTKEHEDTILAASSYLLSGFNQPQRMEPRHVICAARRAVTNLPASSATDGTLDRLRQRIHLLVRKSAPLGVRGAGASRNAFLVNFARELATPPFSFMGQEV